jgi:hypothetical protein
MIHVVLPKVVYDGPSEGLCHALTVAELPGPALLRLVTYGLTVEPYDINRGQINVPTGTQRTHGLTVQIGHLPFYASHVGTVQSEPQERAAQIGRIACARMGSDS